MTTARSGAAGGDDQGRTPALRCPLCGARVNPAGAACGACPLSRGCGMICCQECGYRFVDRSALLDWLGRAWRRVRGVAPGR